MKIRFINRVSIRTAMAACCLIVLCIGLALSAPSSSSDITGTWSWYANNSTGTLRITQGLNGVITGSAGGVTNDTIEGFYRPTTRRIVFMRKRGGTTPIQLYEGYVSANGERMGGAFHVWNLAGGSEVDYNFHATKVSDTP